MRQLCWIVTVLLLSACKVDHKARNARPFVVCTTSIIRDCVQQIAGDGIEVVSLMGPGIDPHAYNPRPSDVTLLNKATVVIYNGLHLEGKMAQLFDKLKARRTVICVADGIPYSRRILTDSEAGTADPHIWFDTESWLQGLSYVTKELCKAYPKYAEIFRKNYEKYRNRIVKETDVLRHDLETIPQAKRVLITSHDAFHYFGRCFHVKVKALQGISTTQEPGVKDVIGLVDFIVKRKIKALFVEHSVSPKAIRTVIESCERKGQQVRIGGTLYSDALGDATSRGGTYEGMLAHNVHTIIRGLK